MFRTRRSFAGEKKKRSLVPFVVVHCNKYMGGSTSSTWKMGLQRWPIPSQEGFILFFLLNYSWFIMLCQFLLYSVMASHTHRFFSHTIFRQGLSQETGYSSLCCTVGLHCLSILNGIVCIYHPKKVLNNCLPVTKHLRTFKVFLIMGYTMKNIFRWKAFYFLLFQIILG